MKNLFTQILLFLVTILLSSCGMENNFTKDVIRNFKPVDKKVCHSSLGKSCNGIDCPIEECHFTLCEKEANETNPIYKEIEDYILENPSSILTFDKSLCEPVIKGCLDPNATNALVQIPNKEYEEDKSCTFQFCPFMKDMEFSKEANIVISEAAKAYNLKHFANSSRNSNIIKSGCSGKQLGCASAIADNQTSLDKDQEITAIVDDGSCTVTLCCDSKKIEFNTLAAIKKRDELRKYNEFHKIIDPKSAGSCGAELKDVSISNVKQVCNGGGYTCTTSSWIDGNTLPLDFKNYVSNSNPAADSQDNAEGACLFQNGCIDETRSGFIKRKNWNEGLLKSFNAYKLKFPNYEATAVKSECGKLFGCIHPLANNKNDPIDNYEDVDTLACKFDLCQTANTEKFDQNKYDEILKYFGVTKFADLSPEQKARITSIDCGSVLGTKTTIDIQTQKTQLPTEIVMVLDPSASMTNIKEATKNAMTQLFVDLKNNDLNVKLTLMPFDVINHVGIPFDPGYSFSIPFNVATKVSFTNAALGFYYSFPIWAIHSQTTPLAVLNVRDYATVGELVTAVSTVFNNQPINPNLTEEIGSCALMRALENTIYKAKLNGTLNTQNTAFMIITNENDSTDEVKTQNIFDRRNYCRKTANMFNPDDKKTVKIPYTEAKTIIVDSNYKVPSSEPGAGLASRYDQQWIQIGGNETPLYAPFATPERWNACDENNGCSCTQEERQYIQSRIPQNAIMESCRVRRIGQLFGQYRISKYFANNPSPSPCSEIIKIKSIHCSEEDPNCPYVEKSVVQHLYQALREQTLRNPKLDTNYYDYVVKACTEIDQQVDGGTKIGDSIEAQIIQAPMAYDINHTYYKLSTTNVDENDFIKLIEDNQGLKEKISVSLLYFNASRDQNDCSAEEKSTMTDGIKYTQFANLLKNNNITTFTSSVCQTKISSTLVSDLKKRIAVNALKKYVIKMNLPLVQTIRSVVATGDSGDYLLPNGSYQLIIEGNISYLVITDDSITEILATHKKLAIEYI